MQVLTISSYDIYTINDRVYSTMHAKIVACIDDQEALADVKTVQSTSYLGNSVSAAAALA